MLCPLRTHQNDIICVCTTVVVVDTIHCQIQYCDHGDWWPLIPQNTAYIWWRYSNRREGKVACLCVCNLSAYHQVWNLQADEEHQHAPHQFGGTHFPKCFEKLYKWTNGERWLAIDDQIITQLANSRDDYISQRTWEKACFGFVSAEKLFAILPSRVFLMNRSVQGCFRNISGTKPCSEVIECLSCKSIRLVL